MRSSDSYSDPVTRYSHTQRIVLLIDVEPFLHHQNPTHYTSTVLSAATTLLSFPSLSSSLFSFKLFFSSLSPLLSSTKLHHSHSLSFDHPSPTLTLLSRALSSIPTFSHASSPKSSHVASSLRQLLHDYAWDWDWDREPPTHHHHVPLVPSNLVVLFSPLCDSLENLSGFFDANVEDMLLPDVGSFCERFNRVFGGLKDLFHFRDIHCSWVGVSGSSGSECDDFEMICELFENGVKGLGWGFCNVNSIVFGSALVPFGLIYPKIGVCWGNVDVNDCPSRQVQLQLNLKILGVEGNPLEYNCCDLELIDFRTLVGHGGCEKKERFWKFCLDGITKFEVKFVQRCDAFVNLGDCLSDSVLVREDFKESKRNQKGSSTEFFADRVLEKLAAEFGCNWKRKSVPIWGIISSFLFKEGYWALVSLTNSNGRSCMGILRPFTVSSALLSVLGDPDMASDASVAQYIRTVDAGICESDRELKKNRDLLDSQAMICAKVIEDRPKKKMMDLSTVKNLSWSSFSDLVYDQFETDLHEVYSAAECNKSKKLKFLKWWMKQMKKSGHCNPTLSEKKQSNQIAAEENNGKLAELPQIGEQPFSSSSSAGINTEASRVQDDVVLDFRSETSEAFFSNLSNKIQQGIQSEVIDLGALAARLVNSCVYWLYQKVDRETNLEGNSLLKGQNARGCRVAAELIKLILRDPKELATQHKSTNSCSQASDAGATTPITEYLIREYELQILFRMEILQSEVVSGVEDSSKRKFVKQICQLLENIQCRIGGGFFDDWTLDSYVAKIIKSRYSHTLEDVVHKIYNKMDLLLFSDKDEAPNNLLKIEDSKQFLNKEVYREEMGENVVSNEPTSSENEPFQLHNTESVRFQGIIQEDRDRDRDRKLIEAKERRERAGRFSSFTSWKPDLRRVWAPKQKGVKPDPSRNQPQRKDRKRASRDKVCETPMSGNKRASSWKKGSGDGDYRADTNPASGSVSKALFRDGL